jgi:hypothetical protein
MVAPFTGLVLVILTSLVSVAATFGARAAPLRRDVMDALAVGIVLALVVDLVPRLTGSAMVVLGSVVRDFPVAAWRTPVASAGPVLIQTITPGLLVGGYVLTLRARRVDRHAGGADGVLCGIGLSSYAFADALTAASSGWLLAGPLTGGLVLSLALVYASRGFALGSGFDSAGSAWVMFITALLSGSAGALMASVGPALPPAFKGPLAIVLLTVAALLFVYSLGARLGPDQRVPLRWVGVGFALSLASNRWLAANVV